MLTNAVTVSIFPSCCFCPSAATSTIKRRWYTVVYGGSLLCMAVGRLIVYAVGPTLDHSLWLLIVMALVVLVEATLILRPHFMGRSPVGFELGTMAEYCAVEPQAAREEDPVGHFAANCGLSENRISHCCPYCARTGRSFIAEELNYSENTIRNYTRTVYRKAGVHSKQELLRQSVGRISPSVLKRRVLDLLDGRALVSIVGCEWG